MQDNAKRKQIFVKTSFFVNIIISNNAINKKKCRRKKK